MEQYHYEDVITWTHRQSSAQIFKCHNFLHLIQSQLRSMEKVLLNLLAFGERCKSGDNHYLYVLLDRFTKNMYLLRRTPVNLTAKWVKWCICVWASSIRNWWSNSHFLCSWVTQNKVSFCPQNWSSNLQDQVFFWTRVEPLMQSEITKFIYG